MPIKILMADGDHADLELARATMSSVQWCDLVTVESGKDAAELLQKQKFDGLITASRIPQMDAFELIARLKYYQLNASIPIVMVTGENEVEIMRLGFRAGVTFFAIKPRTRERVYRLFNAVRGAMEKERRRHHRLPYHTTVICTLGEGQRRFVAECVEISEGGMSVKPSGGLEVGQVLELEFLLPQVSRPAPPESSRPGKAVSGEREATKAKPQRVRAKVTYLFAGRAWA